LLLDDFFNLQDIKLIQNDPNPKVDVMLFTFFGNENNLLCNTHELINKINCLNC